MPNTKISALAAVTKTTVSTADVLPIVHGASTMKIAIADLIVPIDSIFGIVGTADQTKKAVFSASSLSTATTRTFTLPDANVVLVGDTNIQTLTNKTLTSPQINFGSDAAGDIIIRGATGFTQRLSAGAANTILSISATTGLPAWIANPSAAIGNQTTAGVFQAATAAQITAGTATGSTGANLVITPDQLALSSYATPGATASQYTAGIAITAGQAVAVGYVQADGGIKLDTSGNVASGSGTITIAANSNRGLIVWVTTGGASVGVISGVTYNGTSMTQIDSFTFSDINGHNQQIASYYLNAPTSGTLTLNVNLGSGTVATCGYVSIYNVSQTSQPEAHSSASNTVTMSTIANGAVIFTGGGITTTSGTFTGFSGTGAFTSNAAIYASSGQVFPGATSITVSKTGTGGIQLLSLSIAPATAVSNGAFPTSTAVGLSQFQTNYGTFVGFATTSAIAGASVTVATGGQVTNQTGLTPGQYYLNDATGTIGKVPGTNTRKAGIATSATNLIITNIW